MITGKVARIFPGQNYGVVEPDVTSSIREIIILPKDQRALNRDGRIVREKIRTTPLSPGARIRLILDHRSETAPIAFLWAQVPEEKVEIPLSRPVPASMPGIWLNAGLEEEPIPENPSVLQEPEKQPEPAIEIPLCQFGERHSGNPDKKREAAEKGVRKDRPNTKPVYPVHGYDFSGLRREVHADPLGPRGRQATAPG